VPKLIDRIDSFQSIFANTLTSHKQSAENNNSFLSNAA
jgi:hypothetical protein